MWKKYWRIGRVTLALLLLLSSVSLAGCHSENSIQTSVAISETKESFQPDRGSEEKEDSRSESQESPNKPEADQSPEQTAEPVPKEKTEKVPAASAPQKSPPDTPIHPFYSLDGTPPSAPGLAMQTRVFDQEPEKIVYLTFDDGPYPETTPHILEILQEEGVKATFFVLGRQVERYPELVLDEYEQGHGIGNHSYSHDYNSVYRSTESFLAEIKQAEKVIFETIGVKPQIVRAPGGTQGHFNVNYYNALDAEDYLVYDWNVSSGDAAALQVPADQLLKNIEAQMPSKPRAIILMHDSKPKQSTVAVLPEIIHYLKERGYSFGVITPKVAPILFPGGFNS